jgi:hypothetical protein
MCAAPMIPSFREWVAAHGDEDVHLRWENWDGSTFERTGRLIGWFWGRVVIETRPRSAASTDSAQVVATLERLGEAGNLGLGQVIQEAERELATELRADDPKKITEVSFGRDRRECVLGTNFALSYDDPSDPAVHDERPCPIHDEPGWGSALGRS